jgi:hypothetical protein
LIFDEPVLRCAKHLPHRAAFLILYPKRSLDNELSSKSGDYIGPGFTQCHSKKDLDIQIAKLPQIVGNSTVGLLHRLECPNTSAIAGSSHWFGSESWRY